MVQCSFEIQVQSREPRRIVEKQPDRTQPHVELLVGELLRGEPAPVVNCRSR